METGIIEAGGNDLAKYPWLADAKPASPNSFFEETMQAANIETLVEKAMSRINIALKSEFNTNLENVKTEAQLYIIILSICKLTNNPKLYHKIALSIAKRTEQFLLDSLTEHIKLRDKAMHEFVLQILRRDLKMAVEHRPIFDDCENCKNIIEFEKKNALRHGEEWQPKLAYLLRVPEYLKRSVKFHSKDWKLVNQVVHGGYVSLSEKELIRFARDEIEELLVNRIASLQLPMNKMPFQIIESAELLSEQYNIQFSTASFVPQKYPPCIQHVLDLFSKGENVPHTARILFVSYMNKLGKPADEIADMFKNAPDYKESVTNYQVNFIVDKGYSPNNCDKLKNLGWCFEDSGCAGIRNPLAYGRKSQQEEHDNV